MNNLKLLSFKEILILVLLSMAVALLALVAFGPRIGNIIIYTFVVAATIVALINKNTSLKQKLITKLKSKRRPNS